MSKKHVLNATHRNRSGSGLLNSLRREGFVPAVIYGRGVENENLKVIRKEVETVLHSTHAEQILVNLTIGEKDTRLALIQAVQHDPLTGSITHLDFHQVREDELIHANIPVELSGEPAGVKLGGMLEHLIHKLEVRCLPKDLPEFIKVDVSALGLGEALHVKELALPEGVKAGADGDIVVAMVAEPKGGSTDTAAAEAAPAADAKGKAAAPAKDAKAAPAAKGGDAKGGKK